MITIVDTGDVIYAKRAGATVRTSTEAPHDDRLILNMADDGTVVGVQLVDVEPEEWKMQPDRNMVPKDILDAVDRWLFAERR